MPSQVCGAASGFAGANERSECPAARIALISDDVQMRSLLHGLLVAHGYRGAVGVDSSSAATGYAGWDVAIVDVSSLRTAAVQLLAALKNARTPTVAIFAKNDSAAPHEIAACSDVLLGTPFDPRELLLLIRGMLDVDTDEADAMPLLGSTVAAGPIALSPLLNSANVGSRRIELTDVEKRILQELLANATRPVTRERLTRRALLRAWSPDDRSLDTHINRLRRKVGRDVHGRTPIRTVTGVGYLLLAEWVPAA